MSNNEKNKVVPLKREYEGYVSLDEYNKIKYDLYRKEKEIERKDREMQDLYNRIDYYINEYNKSLGYIHNYNMSSTVNINNQIQHDFNYFKQMYIEFTKEKNKEIQNKDNEIQRLKDEKEELKDINTKLKNKLNNNIRLLFNYKEGDKIDKNFINILLDMIFDNNTNNNLIENNKYNKDGE